MEQIVQTMTEATTTATPDQVEQIAIHLSNIETLMYYIVGILIAVFFYGCFKFISYYFKPFF